MSHTASRRAQVVLHSGTGTGMSAADRAALARLLLERGLEVSCRRDYQSDDTRDPANLPTLVDVAGGAPAQPAAAMRVINGHGSAPTEIADAVGRGSTGSAGNSTWKPWFPVIDYSRCTNCMQCLSFCLFDVYGVSADQKIQVQNQSNCKTECPACSRVCPEVAIMFPKYRHGPINGEEIKADDVRREAMKVDISALLGGDIYSMLRDRSVKAKSRFSKERDDERALKERQNCLVALKNDLDIPAEVLAALPSPEEIMAKAEAARLRAQTLTRTPVEEPKS